MYCWMIGAKTYHIMTDDDKATLCGIPATLQLIGCWACGSGDSPPHFKNLCPSCHRARVEKMLFHNTKEESWT